METLELSRVCRLCGRQTGITIDIFGKRGNHAKKINMVLPILVHEMDLLPKHICHPCNYKLLEFHQFYEDCLKTDANLKSQLSWMQRTEVREEIDVPMVQINNIKIKREPLDYVEQDYTEAILNKEKMTNYEENHCTGYREKFVQFPDNQCSHCGSYCGNQNHVNDDFSNNCSKTTTTTATSKEHNSTKENDLEYPSRDMARRNLFATEIFRTKNPRIQTEIPICNESRRFFNDKVTNDVNSLESLKRSSEQQNDVDVEAKIEISNISTIMPSRTLRPRKLDIRKNLTNSRLSKNTNVKLINHEIRRASKENTKSSGFVEIKTEIPSYFERSLRPRFETIDYSDTKRKNPLARGTRESEERVKKVIKILSDDSVCEKVQRVNDNDSLVKKHDVKRAVSSSSFLVVKLERDNFTESHSKTHSNIRKINKIIKSPFEMRNKRRNTSTNVTKEEIVNGAINEKIVSQKNVKTFKRSDSSVKRFNDKMFGVDTKKKNMEKKIRKSTICLRSQIGYLKNGKLMKFDLIVNGPDTTVNKNYLSRNSLNSHEEKTSRINDKTLSTIMKYHDCNNCEERFASQELYRLHACYANKRH